MSNCLKTQLKGSVDNITLPVLGGLAIKLPLASTPQRLTILCGNDLNGTLPLTIEIKGDGNFVDQDGTNPRSSIVNPTTYSWYKTTGEAYLHISAISNLGNTLNIEGTLADFDIKLLKIYARDDNRNPLTSVNVKKSNVYGNVTDFPETVLSLGVNKNISGNVALLATGVNDIDGTADSIPVLSYSGSRKGSGVHMAVCYYVNLGNDVDAYLKDCAECDAPAGGTWMELYGTSSYDTDSDVQSAVATLYSKGIQRIYVTTNGTRRLLGTPQE